MDPIQKWMKGKKTYVVISLFIIGKLLEARGMEIPSEVFAVLVALGCGTLAAKAQRMLKGDTK